MVIKHVQTAQVGIVAHLPSLVAVSGTPLLIMELPIESCPSFWTSEVVGRINTIKFFPMMSASASFANLFTRILLPVDVSKTRDRIANVSYWVLQSGVWASSCLVQFLHAELRLHHHDFSKRWFVICCFDISFRHSWRTYGWSQLKGNALFIIFLISPSPSTWSSIKEPGWQFEGKRMTFFLETKRGSICDDINVSCAPLAIFTEREFDFSGFVFGKGKIETFCHTFILHGAHGSGQSLCNNEKFEAKDY